MIQKKLLPLYLLLILFAALEGKTEASWYEKTKTRIQKCKKKCTKFIETYPKTSLLLAFAAVAGLTYGGHSLYQWNERQLAVERERVEALLIAERKRNESAKLVSTKIKTKIEEARKERASKKEENIGNFLNGRLMISPKLQENITKLKDKIANNNKGNPDYTDFEKTIFNNSIKLLCPAIQWDSLKSIPEKALTSEEFNQFLRSKSPQDNDFISFNKSSDEIATQILEVAFYNYHIYIAQQSNPQKFPNADIICKKIIHFILNNYSLNYTKPARR